jgi:2-C-methyl-D-erythritol 4-phosphate cytidylyltransferase
MVLLQCREVADFKKRMQKYFALIPAAGGGARMGAELPKQYLDLAGRPLLAHAVQRLCAEPRIAQVFVVLAPGDSHFARYDWSRFAPRLEPLYCGGETRAASVFNGLLAAHDAIAAADWVLVHDAARPCLGAAELGRLIDGLGDDDTGGLLAVPVADTLKRASRDGQALSTEARDQLWQAQTPQMFRYRLLLEALRAANPALTTDESSAIENLGLRPKLVMGSARNLKVTYPEDLALAALILKSMETADERR